MPFITLEGIDGCGKSTQAAMLADELEEDGYDVVRLREPGGTATGDRIRGLLLDPDAGMSDECELLLFEAARAQLVSEVIAPALERGAVVVSDRYYDSTYAYQAGGRGMDRTVVAEANRLGSLGVDPDVTVIVDLPVERAYARATEDGADRMEAAGMAFQERVRDAYMDAALLSGGRIRIVDGDGTPVDVHGRVMAEVRDVLP